VHQRTGLLYRQAIQKPYDKPSVICPAGILPIHGRSTLPKEIYSRIVGKREVRNADTYVTIVRGNFPCSRAKGVSAERAASGYTYQVGYPAFVEYKLLKAVLPCFV
jgi:hypothetical protein